MHKLRDRRGETLAETLCAILVLALAAALMVGMISTASRLDRKTDQAAAELYQSFSGAEGQESDVCQTEGTVSVQIGDDTENIAVEFYGNQDQVVSYRAETEGDAP